MHRKRFVLPLAVASRAAPNLVLPSVAESHHCRRVQNAVRVRSSRERHLDEWLILPNLDARCARARNAGSPRATCDEAGTGIEPTARLLRHFQRTQGVTDRPILWGTAPALDPTVLMAVTRSSPPRRSEASARRTPARPRERQRLGERELRRGGASRTRARDPSQEPAENAAAQRAGGTCDRRTPHRVGSPCERRAGTERGACTPRRGAHAPGRMPSASVPRLPECAGDGRGPSPGLQSREPGELLCRRPPPHGERRAGGSIRSWTTPRRARGGPQYDGGVRTAHQDSRRSGKSCHETERNSSTSHGTMRAPRIRIRRSECRYGNLGRVTTNVNGQVQE